MQRCVIDWPLVWTHYWSSQRSVWQLCASVVSVKVMPQLFAKCQFCLRSSGKGWCVCHRSRVSPCPITAENYCPPLMGDVPLQYVKEVLIYTEWSIDRPFFICRSQRISTAKRLALQTQLLLWHSVRLVRPCSSLLNCSDTRLHQISDSKAVQQRSEVVLWPGLSFSGRCWLTWLQPMN